MSNRKAMILAAGLGTRLYPLTKDRPKALIEYSGRTLLQIAIENLLNKGFQKMIINIHHFPGMILDYLQQNNNFNADITISDERDSLLETGGGLKKASWFFDSGSFLVYNVDVITDLNLESLYLYHLSSNNLATLAVMERDTTRPLLMNKRNQLCGWRNKLTGEEIMVRNEQNLIEVGFSGIYVLRPEIFGLIIETGSFSIMPVFLRLAKGHKIGMYKHEGIWKDMGKIS